MMMNRKVGVPVLACLAAASLAALWAQEMGAPPEMKEVEFMLGTWKADDFRMRMMPEAEWSPAPLTMKVESILDGCAQQSHVTSSVMGMEFHGVAILSYDREEGKWKSSWIDNMSAQQMISEGEYKDGVLTLMGKASQGGQMVWSKDVTKKVSDTELDWHMETSYDGENWFTSMKATYKKQ